MGQTAAHTATPKEDGMTKVIKGNMKMEDRETKNSELRTFYYSKYRPLAQNTCHVYNYLLIMP